MGYLGRRIGKSQNNSSSGDGVDGNLGGGILDLFAQGYFAREGNINRSPGLNESGMQATGGVIHDYSTTPGDVFRAHIFTSSGTFNVTEPGSFGDTLEYLVVAGGGGGGGYSGANGGGGGGAGGLRTNLSGHPKAGAAYPVPAFPTSYTVTIGAGGVFQSSPAPGTDGSNSEFHPTPQSYPSTTFVRSIGGGGGGYNPTAGRPGGSSGGGAAPTSSIVPGNASPDPNHPEPQGNAGGHGGSNGSRAGGGGGGAASDGGNASGSFPGGLAGYGGKAVQVAIAGPPTLSAAGTPGETGQGWYAGGGGGAGADETFPDSKRGIGGRGNDRTGTTPWGGGGNGAPGGSPAIPRALMNGTGGTGGGGGGGRESPNPGGNGGSGVVIVRYQIASVASQKATGGAVSFVGSKTVHSFTQSGAFTTNAGFNETVEYVIVGGGGAGGTAGPNAYGAGGGGAGQMLVASTPISTPSSTPHAVVIGGGGSYSTSTNVRGNPGAPSSVAFPGGTINGYGGGGGGSNRLDASQTGGDGLNHPNVPAGSGSGGGATMDNPSGGAGGPSAKGAYPGGGIPIAPSNSAYGGAGGGGAGGAGSPGSDSPGPEPAPWTGGGGGIGLQAPTTFRNPVSATAAGTPGPNPGGFYFAGGGAGGLYEANADPDRVGSGSAAGGGGLGGQSSPSGKGGNATFSTGGGGGGAGAINTPSTFYGGNGGSGIVLIAYPT